MLINLYCYFSKVTEKYQQGIYTTWLTVHDVENGDWFMLYLLPNTSTATVKSIDED